MGFNSGFKGLTLSRAKLGPNTSHLTHVFFLPYTARYISPLKKKSNHHVFG